MPATRRELGSNRDARRATPTNASGTAAEHSSLINDKDVVLVETSSAAWEPSFVGLPKRLRPPDARRNKRRLSEFTHADIEGMRSHLMGKAGAVNSDLAVLKPKYSPLVQLLLLGGFFVGAKHDATGRLRWTNPQSARRFLTSTRPDGMITPHSQPAVLVLGWNLSQVPHPRNLLRRRPRATSL